MKDVLSKDVLSRVCGLAIVLALALTFALTGCASDDNSKDSDQNSESTEQQAPETIAVNMSVTDLDGNSLFDGVVEVAPESTVFDVLEQSGVEFVSETGEYGAYLTSIAGIEVTSNTGWTYTVNNEQPPVSADQQEVADGDVVAWQLVTW